MSDSETAAIVRRAKEPVVFEFVLVGRYAINDHYLLGTELA